jgi:hypothetical protein
MEVGGYDGFTDDGNRKLSEQAARQVFESTALDNVIAQQLSVSPRTINRIRNRLTYRHATLGLKNNENIGEP